MILGLINAIILKHIYCQIICANNIRFKCSVQRLLPLPFLMLRLIPDNCWGDGGERAERERREGYAIVIGIGDCDCDCV